MLAERALEMARRAPEDPYAGLAPEYIGRRIGPWLLDRAIERGFARGASTLALNTNTVDHPRALDTYRKTSPEMVVFGRMLGDSLPNH